VALKFLPRDVKEGSRRFQHFLSEVRLSRQIAHPNVCRVYDIDEVDGQHFLSMEYIDGEDLKGLLRRIGRLPKDKGIQIAQQLCAGLAAAHEKGVLHRDLKPANVMLDGRGQARITDFGLARLADGAAGTGEFAGTPAYMAPEQLARGETTVQSDLYSLGLILHELFTGQPVHRSGSLNEVIRSREDSTPTQPSTLVDDLDPAVERAILRCLQKEPGQRPKSARAVAASLPGGDPLAAALAAGETPSPEMVAAAGGQGAIEKRRGLCCLAGVALGLALVCGLAQRTYLVNQVGLERHPESLADSARQILGRLGYTNHPVQQAHGFVHGFVKVDKDKLRFWYRQNPKVLLANVYWNDWGEPSLGRINHFNPPFFTPGQLAVQLDGAGKLTWFRAIPFPEPAHPKIQAAPDWQTWFPREFTGFDLAALEPIEDQGVPPPDAFDQLQVWKGSQPGSGGNFYVEAAAYAGKPVYFCVLSPAEFEQRNSSTSTSPRPQAERAPTSRARGEALIYVLIWMVWTLSGVLAWRNFRLGRGDRKGAFRVAFFLVCIGMLSWLFLASHTFNVGVFEIGSAQVFWRAAFFWLTYLALEPYVRRLWPQVLISWSRLANGQWRDPLVGQNVLVGVLAGVVATAADQFQVLGPAWFGLSPQPFHTSHALALDGPLALVGLLLWQVISVTGNSLYPLMILFLFRLVLPRAFLASCAYIAVSTLVFTLFNEAHPVLGWFTTGIMASLTLWVYLRLGFLAGAVMGLTTAALQAAPLTTNFSAWYAGNSLAVVAFLFALAAFGFYTSQAGRPIFQEAPRDRTS